MNRIVSVFAFLMVFCGLINLGFSQGGQGGGGDGGGFSGGDGQFGGGRVSGREEIQDNRAATNTGDNNTTLGGGDGGGANNMNFLNSLFGGRAANQNVNQDSAVKGRGIRAPFRLGFKFDGMSVDKGVQQLNARIVRIPKFRDSKITGVLQGKTLVLVGEVASREEASLAERIARFEPGVDQVKSQLKIVGLQN
ncbi:MAG: BON domain-containing protein [Planctomycetota bacterium]|nr:BON domain-containing protein [Planctomycetota bacterium]